MTKKVWDHHAIKAEIRRRGETLTSLAQSAGLPGATLRWAFSRPSPAANLAIARFIGQPLEVLWPQWFDAGGRLKPVSERQTSTGNGQKASRERRLA